MMLIKKSKHAYHAYILHLNFWVLRLPFHHLQLPKDRIRTSLKVSTMRLAPQGFVQKLATSWYKTWLHIQLIIIISWLHSIVNTIYQSVLAGFSHQLWSTVTESPNHNQAHCFDTWNKKNNNKLGGAKKKSKKTKQNKKETWRSAEKRVWPSALLASFEIDTSESINSKPGKRDFTEKKLKNQKIKTKKQDKKKERERCRLNKNGCGSNHPCCGERQIVGEHESYLHLCI